MFAGGWRTERIADDDVTAGRGNDHLGAGVIVTTPRAVSGNKIEMHWGAIGIPLVSRPVSFLIGGRIAKPKTDEDGKEILDPEGYWKDIRCCRERISFI